MLEASKNCIALSAFLKPTPKNKDEDFIEFAESLNNHPYLEVVDFGPGPRVKRDAHTGGCSDINPLVAALETVPNLSTVRLFHLSPPLRELRGIKQDAGSLCRLVALPGLTQISSLLLCPKTVGRLGFDSLYSAIGNRKSLQRLTLTVGLIDEQGYQELGNAIWRNQSIKFLALDITGGGGIMGEYLCHIIRALEKSSTIERLKFAPIFVNMGMIHFGKKIQNSLVSLAQNNLSIMNITPSITESYPKIECFIEEQSSQLMNDALRRNRDLKSLMKILVDNSNAPRSQWIEALVLSKDHIIGIVSVLSKNPSLYGLNPQRASLLRQHGDENKSTEYVRQPEDISNEI